MLDELAAASSFGLFGLFGLFGDEAAFPVEFWRFSSADVARSNMKDPAPSANASAATSSGAFGGDSLVK